MSDDLALTYNDSSPMENHHVAAAFRVLRTHGFNFLRRLARDRLVSAPSRPPSLAASLRPVHGEPCGAVRWRGCATLRVAPRGAGAAAAAADRNGAGHRHEAALQHPEQVPGQAAGARPATCFRSARPAPSSASPRPATLARDLTRMARAHCLAAGQAPQLWLPELNAEPPGARRRPPERLWWAAGRRRAGRRRRRRRAGPAGGGRGGPLAGDAGGAQVRRRGAPGGALGRAPPLGVGPRGGVLPAGAGGVPACLAFVRRARRAVLRSRRRLF